MGTITSQEQNLQEAEIAVEQLKEYLGQNFFQQQCLRTEALIKELKLTPEHRASIQKKLEQLIGEQASIFVKISSDISQEVLETLTVARIKLNQSDDSQPDRSESAVSIFRDVDQTLELALTQLEMERNRLTLEHQEACWRLLKSIRSDLKNKHHKRSLLQQESAEQLYHQAETAIQEEPLIRNARETFTACQYKLKALDLSPDQRRVFHSRFNQLWELLQERSLKQRNERQKRQEEGLQRLKEALRRVQSIIMTRESDLKTQRERLENTHWHEMDTLEKQISRNEHELKDANRRQEELLLKIKDAQSRLAHRPNNTQAP